MNEHVSTDLLLIEDNPQDLELAMLAPREANPSTRIHLAHDGAEAVDFIFCEGPHAGRRITDS